MSHVSIYSFNFLSTYPATSHFIYISIIYQYISIFYIDVEEMIKKIEAENNPESKIVGSLQENSKWNM